MKTKLAIVGVIMAMLPNLSAYAGESPAQVIKEAAAGPTLYRARAGSKARVYYRGYRKPGYKKAKTMKTAHWQTKVWK